MLTRVITGAVLLIIFVPVLFLSDELIFDIIIAGICLVGTIELLRCVKIANKYIISVPSCLFAAAVPIMIRYVKKEAIVLMLVAYLFYLLYASVFARKTTSTSDIALSFFATIYVTMSFSSILVTRSLPHGELIYLMIFIGAWSTDTFAYFTGRLFGKHKLIPDVSPKKTIEGAIGGIVFCSLGFMLYGFIIMRMNSLEAVPDYLLLAVTGIITSVVAQLGDLSASAIKRNYNVKDYGSIFPGHGGVLDRFDSVMAVAPIIMIIGAVLMKFGDYGLFT